MKYKIGTVTRVGNRKENEDSYGSFSNDKALVMVVADGMGGHQGGKLASESVVRGVGEHFAKERGLISDPVAFLQKSLLTAHDEINFIGACQDPPIQPRTTVVICLVQNGHAWWVHAGDSRLYLIRHGNLVFRTRDHSRMEELVSQGIITAKQALTHPERSQITRCVGGPVLMKEFTFSKAVPLHMGDTILMCTDGLWNPMRSKRIVELIGNGQVDDILSDMASKAEALSMPHSDNITAILMRWASAFKPDAGLPVAESKSDEPQKQEEAAPKDEVADAVDALKSIFDEYEKELK